MAEQLKRGFLLWLQTQLKRHKINCGEYFFADILNHGVKKLFVSDMALRQFGEREGMLLPVLKTWLKTQGIVENASYVFVNERGHKRSLVAIETLSNINQEVALNGKIRGESCLS